MKPEPFCLDCPDHEACYLGASCEYVRKVNTIAAQFNEILTTGKVPPKMSNAPKTSATPKTVADQAAEEKLVTSVPTQGEKAKEVVEETTEAVKTSFKDRVARLGRMLKEEKKFFVGFASGVVATMVFASQMPKANEEVEVIVGTEAPEVDSDELSA